MTAEKKIKLDDLPEEGSSSVLPPRKKFKKKKADPRLERFKELSDAEKSERLNQRWHFDKPDLRFGWLAYVLIILGWQFSGFGAGLDMNKNQMSEFFEGLNGIENEFYNLLTLGLGDVFRNPVIFLVLTPLFFKFLVKSHFFLEIGFDGIHTVKQVTTGETKPLRTLIKWNVITAVQIRQEGSREILELLSPAGKVGEVIWDLKLSQKRAMKLIIQGMIHKDHCFRQFLEKEIA